MTIYDTFFSYATEDTQIATEITHGLQANGLSVWFAPLQLKIGDKLPDSIEEGLEGSRCGILLISQTYLAKKWTTHEMNVLIRQHWPCPDFVDTS